MTAGGQTWTPWWTADLTAAIINISSEYKISHSHREVPLLLLPPTVSCLWWLLCRRLVQ